MVMCHRIAIPPHHFSTHSGHLRVLPRERLPERARGATDALFGVQAAAHARIGT